MSAVERNVVKDTVVIADNLNYIKGYRYQLHCVSRAANTPHCAVRIVTILIFIIVLGLCYGDHR